MTKAFTKIIPGVTAVLLFVLMGGPQMTQAWAAPPQQAEQQSPANNGTTPPAQDQQAAPNASDASTQPAQQNAQPLPDSPGTAQQNQQQPASRQNKKDQAPLGAGVAQQGTTAGGAASKPAGSAIAPAKQRQMRSLLIKIGLIAAAGGAIGAVYGLSRATGPKPPGAH